MLKFRLCLVIFLLILTAPLYSGENFIVKRVVDGDTITLHGGSSAITVRLIGIDTPESRINKKTRRDSNRSGMDLNKIVAQGRLATSFVKTLIAKGDRVTLEYDLQRHDKYGRTLAYVYLSDGRMLNEMIIGSGYASPLTIPPNVKYRDRLMKSYKKARENKLGLWKED